MQAIDSLMTLEKNCRVNQDANSLGKILVCIVNICYTAKAWNDLNDQIVSLTKVDFYSHILAIFILYSGAR